MKLQGIIGVKWANDPALDVAGKILLGTYMSHNGVTVPGQYTLNAVGPWNDVCDDRTHGEFTDSTDVVNGVVVHTSNLTFQLMPDAEEDFPYGNVKSAWKFKDREGVWRMLGNGEKPFPVATISTDNSSGSAEKKTVTVSWKSFTGPLLVL